MLLAGISKSLKVITIKRQKWKFLQVNLYVTDIQIHILLIWRLHKTYPLFFRRLIVVAQGSCSGFLISWHRFFCNFPSPSTRLNGLSGVSLPVLQWLRMLFLFWSLPLALLATNVLLVYTRPVSLYHFLFQNRSNGVENSVSVSWTSTQCAIGFYK